MLFTKPLPNPTAPVPLTPVVGASLNDTTPVFTWKPVTGASQYRIQLSDTADFASIGRDELISDTTYTDIGLPEGLFYWRVMSKNPLGIESPWSDVFSFVIDTTAPTGPSLSSPINGASVEGTPTLEWGAVSDANGYMVEIDDSFGFSAPVVYSNPATTDGQAITSTSLKPTTLAAGVTYYWHVRSRDAAGNWGSWSSTRSFNTASPVPQAPQLSSPSTGIVINTSTPTLSWNAVDYGARYEVQISSDPAFISADFEKVLKSPGELSHIAAAGMADATKYYWRVHALNNASVAGPWSEVRNFIIDTTGPAAPVLNLPAVESTFIGIPTFTWTAVATANAYQFQYSIDGFMTEPPVFSTSTDTPITTTSYKPTSLSTGMVYTWRVRARDAYGNWGNWSATRWVNIQASLPPAPVVTAPAIGLITNNPTPDFAWNAVTGAANYEIQVDNLSTFASPEIVDSSETNTYTLSSSLPADGLYYYRVRAVNATGGPGAWSATRSLTFDTVAPGDSVLISPLNAATPVGTPTFTWKAVTGANAYQFQYSTDVTFTTIDYSTPGPGYPGTPLAVAAHKPLGNMPAGIPYYWHVRARDAAGNWGEWTFSRLITIQAALPGVPVVTGPAIGFVTNNTTPAFTWNVVTNAVAYDIQIDNLSTFISPEIEENTASSAFSPSSALPADGIYYYRVRAVNATGGAGLWSAARSFTLDTTAPAAPNLSTPVDGATPVGTPAFIWIAAAGATNYQFQYSSDNTFSSVDYSTPGDTIPGTPLAVTSHKPTVNMVVGTTYYWRARAMDKAGNWGAWSTVRSITTQATLPGVPVVTAPALGLVTNNTTPTFTWNTVTGAVSYDIQIDNLVTFVSPELIDSSATNSFTPSSPITPDAFYYYRVRAVNATGGAGLWSGARSFILDTTAPAAPNLSTPVDGATPVGTPVFIWGVAAGATNYQFQYSTDNTFSSVDYSTPGDTVPGTPLAVTSHKPTVNMVVGTTYYWRARARDKAGNWGAWSTVRSIITQATLPVAPVVTSPALGLVTNNTTPTFTWNAVAGATSYDVQIDNLSTFASPEVTGNTGSTSFTPSSPITPDSLYYWRVRTVNATGGGSAWTAARTLTIDTTAPAAPALSTPIDSVTPVGTPIFIWAAAVGANAYQFQYSSDSSFTTVDYSTPGESVPGTPITTISHKPTINMTAGTLYYWRVRARDLAGNWGSWSIVRSLRPQAVLPGIPVVTSPAVGTITNNTTPTFTWNAVTGAVSYDVQIDNLITFASPEVIGNTGTTSFVPSSPITPDGLYYYRVRAVNVTGGAGLWSAARSFTLDTAAPAAPNLSSPLNGVASVGNPTFLWGGVVGGKVYEIEVALTSDFSSPVSLTPIMPIAVTSYKPATALSALESYYWHVRARDVAGNWSTWSATRSVSIVPPVPTAPVLLTPATGTFVNNSKPVFTWNSAVNADSYKIQISRVATFATTVMSATTFSQTFQPGDALGSDGLYYWRVQSINAIGQNSAWSAARTFTLDTVAPSAPVLTAPVEGTILAPGIPNFTWAAAVGANAYQFQMDDFFGNVYTTPGGPAAEFTAGTPITVTSHKPPVDKMTPAVLYYWRVRSRDAAGNWSAWSNYRRVVEQTPLPVAPTLSSPADKTWTSSHYPTFSWNSVANAVNYEIQVDQYANFISLNKIDITLASGVQTWSPSSAISGDRYWRVRGINANGLPGPWSAARKLSIEFTSTFTSDAEGWAYSTSQWTLSGGYLVAPGLSSSGSISSATYDAIYSDFTYEARMRMPLSSSAPSNYIDNVYGVFVHAGTSSSTIDFSNGYMFLIGQIRDPYLGDWSVYTIYKISNASWSSMTGGYWYWVQSVNPGEWATIKAVSNGSTLGFYVNGMLIKSIANAGPKFGKVGVLTWWNYDKQSVYLDYAYMSQAQAITSTSSSASSTSGTRSVQDPGFYAPFGN